MNHKKISSTVIAKLAAFVAGAFLLASCASAGQESADVTASLASPFELGVEETAVIEGQELTVTFQEVTEDSRCPTGVNCVWSGQVITLIGVSLDGQDVEAYNLTLNPGDTKLASVDVGGYLIQLLEVDPYPTADEPAGSSEYTASYVVSSS